MPAYSFQRRFVVPIAMGIKPHTMREPRKRGHARIGDELYLYHGMRTKACRLIGQVVCDAVHSVTVLLLDKDAGGNVATSPPYEPPRRTGDALDDFAQADGFEDWNDLLGFFAKHKPGKAEFTGSLIVWQPAALRLTKWGKDHRQLGLEAARDGQRLTEQFVKEWIGL